MKLWAPVAVITGTLLVVGLIALRQVAVPTAPDPVGSGIRTLRSGTEVELSGPLAGALLAPLRTALAAGARTVQLDSAGGPPDAARALADAVRDAGADTAVTDRCLSACVTVFLAGTRRWVGPFSQIGMEAAYRGSSMLPAYRQSGLPERFLRAVAATPDGEGWFPTRDDLLGSGMATGLADADQFALAGFGPAPTTASIRTRLLAVPSYNAVAQADPAGFESDLAIWDAAVLGGEPGTEAFARTHARLEALAAYALREAPDALLEQHANLFVAELAWMRQHRPADCPAFAAAQGRLPGPDDPDLVARRAALQAVLLTPSRPVGQPSIPAASVDALERAGTSDASTLLDATEPAVTCEKLQHAWEVAAIVQGGSRRLLQAGR